MAFPETTVLAASPLESGDVAVWGGPSRLAYDGVDRLADGRLNFEIGDGPRPALQEMASIFKETAFSSLRVEGVPFQSYAAKLDPVESFAKGCIRCNNRE